MAGKACHGFGSTTQVGLTQGVRRHNQASMDSTLLTGIIGAIATIGAVVLGWYLQRPTTDSPKAPSPVSPEEDASKAYARRYLEYQSHYRFIKAIPKFRPVVQENAKKGGEAGGTEDKGGGAEG